MAIDIQKLKKGKLRIKATDLEYKEFKEQLLTGTVFIVKEAFGNSTKEIKQFMLSSLRRETREYLVKIGINPDISITDSQFLSLQGFCIEEKMRVDVSEEERKYLTKFIEKKMFVITNLDASELYYKHMFKRNEMQMKSVEYAIRQAIKMLITN
jgi:hypothetical protein